MTTTQTPTQAPELDIQLTPQAVGSPAVQLYSLSPLGPATAASFVEAFRQHFPALLSPALEHRLAAAAQLVQAPDTISPAAREDTYQVRSQSNPLGSYLVDVSAKTCTCPDSPRATAHGIPCKHRLAVGIRTRGHLWVKAVEEARIQAATIAARQKHQAALDAAAEARKAEQRQARQQADELLNSIDSLAHAITTNAEPAQLVNLVLSLNYALREYGRLVNPPQ